MENFKQEILLIIGLTVFLIVITIGIIVLITLYKKKQMQMLLEKEIMQQKFDHQLLQSQLETQEETFATLGKELHDNVGQLLNSAKLLIGVTQRKLQDPPDTLAIADETLGTAINELRSLSKSLNKEWLQQFNFIENLQTEIKRINAADSLQITFSYNAPLPLKSDEQIILFRIVQEALQNAIKHAQATHINIQITEELNLLSVVIEDDGKGFAENEKIQSGVGLINMQHRTKLLGGNIEWNSSINGTSVIIQLPVKTETE